MICWAPEKMVFWQGDRLYCISNGALKGFIELLRGCVLYYYTIPNPNPPPNTHTETLISFTEV